MLAETLISAPTTAPAQTSTGTALLISIKTPLLPTRRRRQPLQRHPLQARPILPRRPERQARPEALRHSLPTSPGSAPLIGSWSPDSGITGDGVTNASVLTLTGAAAPGAAIDVFDGANPIGTATANSAGSWSFVTPRWATARIS